MGEKTYLIGWIGIIVGIWLSLIIPFLICPRQIETDLEIIYFDPKCYVFGSSENVTSEETEINVYFSDFLSTFA